MEEKFQKFQNFDWVNSDLWQSYYRNLYPSPPLSKLDKYKRKFYKLKIDPDFDINYKITEQQTNNNNYYSSDNNYNNKTSNNATSNNNIDNDKNVFLLKIENIILFFFILSIPFSFHSLKLCFFGFLIRAYNECGIPKFNLEYLQNIMIKDSFQMLMYNILLFIDKFNYYLIFPLVMTSIIYLSENLKILKILIFQTYTESIIKNKTKYLKDRAYIEVIIGFFLIPGVYFQLNSYFIIIFYWQYLRIKYALNPQIRYVFSVINNYVNNYKNSSNCPSIIKLIIDKIQQIFKYFDTNNEQNENYKCSIF